MLHTRLKLAVDDRISPSQYGFRAGRSTSAPLFVVRRLLELHERHGVSFYALFLDWAQAFDSVSHPALRISLTRLGVPSAFVEAVMAIYSTAQFQVKDSSSFSARHSFLRGIRQGCPLSPYLFILVLSVLMEDVTSSYRSQYGILECGHARCPAYGHRIRRRHSSTFAHCSILKSFSPHFAVSSSPSRAATQR